MLDADLAINLDALTIATSGDRQKVVVWIGNDGRHAIHPGVGSCCVSSDLRTARLAVQNLNLDVRDVRADGVAFYAAQAGAA
jgi:hypothetical protein